MLIDATFRAPASILVLPFGLTSLCVLQNQCLAQRSLLLKKTEARAVLMPLHEVKSRGVAGAGVYLFADALEVVDSINGALES